MIAALALLLADGGGATIALLVVITVASAAAYARRFLPAERQRRDQLRVHRELAAANGLDGAEADWLWQVLIGAKLDCPGVVFVRPTLFDERVATVGAPPALAQRVRVKLFGKNCPPTAPT